MKDVQGQNLPRDLVSVKKNKRVVQTFRYNASFLLETTDHYEAQLTHRRVSTFLNQDTLPIVAPHFYRMILDCFQIYLINCFIHF